MPLSIDCPIAAILAERLRTDRMELTTRWLDRIADRVSLAPEQIFPTDDLLDHMPLLIVGIAHYIEEPHDEIRADVPVVSKARELGALRYSQGFDAYQILKDFEILGSILFGYMTRVVDSISTPCTQTELLQCMHRLYRAIAVIQQTTTVQFLELSAARTREREDRLRGFNRLISHELKNTVNAIVGAQAMMRESFVVGEERDRFLEIIGRNAAALRLTLGHLLELSELEHDTRQQKHVLLSHAIEETLRHLREGAKDAGVTIRVREPIPAMEVNAAAMELCLTNYLSNAIKYANPDAAERWVDVAARIDEGEKNLGAERTLVVIVRDNGRGVPQDARPQLFQRFFRAHTDVAADIAGSGLGLSLVRETIEALGGEVSFEPNEGTGSIFRVTLPSRRAEDPS